MNDNAIPLTPFGLLTADQQQRLVEARPHVEMFDLDYNLDACWIGMGDTFHDTVTYRIADSLDLGDMCTDDGDDLDDNGNPIPPEPKRLPLRPGSICVGDYLMCDNGRAYLVVSVDGDGQCIATFEDWIDLEDSYFMEEWQHMNRLGREWRPCYRIDNP